MQHKSDFTVYTEAGAAFFDGRQPYEVCNPRGWTYVYPPIFAIAVAPLHLLPLQNQVIVWFVICVFACWGCVCESRRTLTYLRSKNEHIDHHYTAWFPWLGVAAVCAVALPALNCLQRGQVTIMAVYLLLLGLRLVLTSRTHPARIAGGIVLALPIAIKIIPLLPVAFFFFVQLAAFLRNRWRRQTADPQLDRLLACSMFGLALGLVLFFLLIPAALIGWNANLRHLDTWSNQVLSNANRGTATPGFDKDTHSVRNQCLGNALYRLGNFGAHVFAGQSEEPLVDEINPPFRMMDSPSFDKCLFCVRITLLLTLLLVGLRLAASGDAALGSAAAFGLACAVMLVVSPVARGHYFVFLAPAILYVPLWLDLEDRTRAAKLFTLLPIVLVDLHYIFLFQTGRMGLLGLGTTAWIFAAFVNIARCPLKTSRAAVSDSPDARLPDTRPAMVNRAA